MSNRPVRKIRCTLCQTIGHNIRSCRLFETTKKKGIEIYKSFLFYSIIGSHLHWEVENLRNYPVSDLVLEQEYIEIFEKHKSENELDSLEFILSETLDWVKKLNAVEIKALMYGYKIDKNARKEDIIELLHYIFISETDQEWMHSYSIIDAVPYIYHSCQYYHILERNNATIFCFPILTVHDNVIASLYNIPYREERLRILYEQNRRLLRFHNNEIQRYNTRIQDVDRQISRLDRERFSLINRRDGVHARRNQIADELEIFPKNIVIKKITIIQEDSISTSSDCPICYDTQTPENIVSVNCGHIFCISCILQTILKKYDPAQHRIECNCPICRTRIEKLSGIQENITKSLTEAISSKDLDILELIG